MTALLTIYFICLLLVGGYVAINVYHIVRFRIRDKGDVSPIALFIYLAISGLILVASIIGAVIAYNA